LAFRIQHEYNALLALIEAEDLDEVDEDAEMEKGDKEFIIAELLKLAVTLDYADETGRRKMFALVRMYHFCSLFPSPICVGDSLLIFFVGVAGDMASAESLPEILVTRCLDVLRILSSSERELFMLIVEIVHELRDMVRLGDEAVRPFRDQSLIRSIINFPSIFITYGQSGW
jgi:condensin complex subunit 3